MTRTITRTMPFAFSVALLLLATASLGVGPCAPTSIGALGDGGADAPAPERQPPRAPDAPVVDTAPALPPPAANALPCEQRDQNGCVARDRCRWLTPGCGDQKSALPKSGCFSLDSLNCPNDAACPTGRRCGTYDIDPCGSVKNLDPGTATCASCGMQITLCY